MTTPPIMCGYCGVVGDEHRPTCGNPRRPFRTPPATPREPLRVLWDVCARDGCIDCKSPEGPCALVSRMAEALDTPPREPVERGQEVFDLLLEEAPQSVIDATLKELGSWGDAVKERPSLLAAVVANFTHNYHRAELERIRQQVEALRMPNAAAGHVYADGVNATCEAVLALLTTKPKGDRTEPTPGET